MGIKKADRLKTYEKCGGKCAYCGKDLKIIQNMQVDHIVPKKKGGEDKLENYNPSCRSCNHYKRSSSLEYFRVMLKTLHSRLKKEYIFNVALDYGIVEIKPFDGVFYFEKTKSEEKMMKATYIGDTGYLDGCSYGETYHVTQCKDRPEAYTVAINDMGGKSDLMKSKFREIKESEDLKNETNSEI